VLKTAENMKHNMEVSLQCQIPLLHAETTLQCYNKYSQIST